MTTASEAPKRSTPEMPRTSVSTAPGDRFFFLRPGTMCITRKEGWPCSSYTESSHGTEEEAHVHKTNIIQHIHRWSAFGREKRWRTSRTAGLLDKHTGWRHINTTSVLSLCISASQLVDTQETHISFTLSTSSDPYLIHSTQTYSTQIPTFHQGLEELDWEQWTKLVSCKKILLK